MSIIAPSITVETEQEYKALVDKIQPFAKHVHVDVSDGQFAPVFMVPPEKLWWPAGWIVDIHAMVSQPADYVNQLIALKPRLIVFHAETGVNLLPIFEKVKKYGIKAGIALLKTTVPSTVAEEIKFADHALIFSGDLGHYGGTASMMQLEKIRLIKAINPEIEIGWDGGVNVDNAFTLSQGGVDILNVGGAIGRAENAVAIYDKLVEETNKQGVI